MILDMQGLGPVTFAVHEDEIKRFHEEYLAWIKSDVPRKVFTFHVGRDTRVVRLDMVASYSVPDELFPEPDAKPA
jgi:hypothetical protein